MAKPAKSPKRHKRGLKLFSKAPFNRPTFVVTVIAVAAIGVATLLISKAAVSTAFFEAENGTITGSATSGNDANASNGKYLQFGSKSAPATVTFSRYVIDSAPVGSIVEKTLADLNGDGKLDAVIGTQQPQSGSGGGGIYWYEFPSSGRPSDAWAKHTIIPSGTAYEDMAPLDVDKDGHIDIVASVNNNLYWFKNPGNGIGSWAQNLIGTGYGENSIAFADLDGDGKTDIATNTVIFFQNNATSWTPVTYNPNVHLSVDTLDIGSGKGRINLVSNNISDPTHIYWFENPRETGGNARTGSWTARVVGPSYVCSGGYCPGGTVATISTGDLNGDGRMDIVVGQSEGGDPGLTPPPGGMFWYEAPADRTQAWTKHDIDTSFLDVHRIRINDMNGDGKPDLVTAEQDQSPQRRVAVFYNNGSGSFTSQVLSTEAGHNPIAGDAEGDGDLDILNSPHGYYGLAHPLVIFINNRF